MNSQNMTDNVQLSHVLGLEVKLTPNLRYAETVVNDISNKIVKTEDITASKTSARPVKLQNPGQSILDSVLQISEKWYLNDRSQNSSVQGKPKELKKITKKNIGEKYNGSSNESEVSRQMQTERSSIKSVVPNNTQKMTETFGARFKAIKVPDVPHKSSFQYIAHEDVSNDYPTSKLRYQDNTNYPNFYYKSSYYPNFKESTSKYSQFKYIKSNPTSKYANFKTNTIRRMGTQQKNRFRRPLPAHRRAAKQSTSSSSSPSVPGFNYSIIPISPDVILVLALTSSVILYFVLVLAMRASQQG